MTHRLQHLTSWLLLAAYLCASTVGGLLHSHEHHVEVTGVAVPACLAHFHSHPHASHSHTGHAHASLKHADHEACDGNSANESSDSSHSPEQHHHDDCTVCRFLGQVSLPVQFVAANVPLGLSVDAPARFTAAPCYGVARATLHLRAGPTAV